MRLLPRSHATGTPTDCTRSGVSTLNAMNLGAIDAGPDGFSGACERVQNHSDTVYARAMSSFILRLK